MMTLNVKQGSSLFPLVQAAADSRIGLMEPPPTNNNHLISHHPPIGSAYLDETLPQIDKPVTLTKMKELKFSFGNVLPSLALLQPKPECFITRKDIDSSGNVIRHTARVTVGDAHYESVDKSEQFAKQKAAYKAISNLSDEEALKLSILAQEKLKGLNRKLFRGRERKRASRASVKRRAEKEAQEEEESKKNKVDADEAYFNHSRSRDDEDSNPSDREKTKGSEQDHSFGDYLSKLVEDGFKSIVKGDRSMSTYKVLAGIVMSSGIAINGSQVICVATGDDRINGRHLSTKGEAVNDCHAVVLARRGLVSFLYDQLEKYRTQPEESVFEPAGNDDGLTLRLKIKDGVLFHLYVSSPPCGDACLSSDLSTPSKLGALQTKVKGADGGTAPVSPISNQTMDDFSTGQLLMTMSCSDKMARWNVVGAQGSLLSHVINPVYFHSVVIGNLLHTENVHRAIIGRIEGVKDIAAPFKVVQPIIARTSVRKSSPSFTPKFSVCWVQGWIHHEMINCITGKTLKMESKTGLSELCKIRFFKRFITLASSNPGWMSSLIQPNRESGRISYGNVKAAAEGFRKTNALVVESFSAAGFGRWIKKPSEQDLFQIDF